ncbi:MAG: ABC transporter substrate-binding protein [Burkholderiales bacterium]|nr:ABC transporter substrate-binding protein [Burkholderiales bacterium]
MQSRRRLVLSLGAASLAAGTLNLVGGVRSTHAQGRPLTFCSWGGALSDLEKAAFLEPFGKLKKIEIAYASPTNYAKIKAMVESGVPEWDLVNVGGRFIEQGKDFLETLDMSLIPNAKALDPGWVTSRGIFTSTGATVIAWNTKAFPIGKGPASWKEFWDVKAFPGPRGLYKQLYYNYEAALLAAGTPRNQVYPVTDDKIKLVFEKLREIRSHVKVWWTAGAQPPQLLSSGELALSSAWTGRVLAVMKENAPVTMTFSDGIAWGNAWVVVKGSPHAKVAMEAINYAISEEAQLRLLDVGTYGPSLGAAAARATPEQQKILVTAPDNVRQMLIIDEVEAARYSAKYEAEWNRFLLG